MVACQQSLSLAVLLAVSSQVAGNVVDLFAGDVQFGSARYYEASAGGSCGIDESEAAWLEKGLPGQVVPIALNSPQYERGLSCGLCIAFMDEDSASPSIKYGIVVDECINCDYGGIASRSDTGNAYVSGSSDSLVRWYPVQCPMDASSSVEYVIEAEDDLRSGSIERFVKLQVQNQRVPIARVRIRHVEDDQWISVVNSNGNHFWVTLNPSIILGPETLWDVELTSIFGDVVVDEGVFSSTSFTSLSSLTSSSSSYSALATVAGHVQFPVRKDVFKALDEHPPLPTDDSASSLIVEDDGSDVVVRNIKRSLEAACSMLWRQCGGKSWSGPTCCTEGLKCVYSHAYYSQCLTDPDPGFHAGATAAGGNGNAASTGWPSFSDTNLPFTTLRATSTANWAIPTLILATDKIAPALAPAPAPAPRPATACKAMWSQCGGVTYTGVKCCVTGSYCASTSNRYYSQCKPK